MATVLLRKTISYLSRIAAKGADDEVFNSIRESILQLKALLNGVTPLEEVPFNFYEVGQVLSDLPAGNPIINQKLAIGCFQSALEGLDRDSSPDEWGTFLYALGNAYSDYMGGNPSENQERAMGIYEQILSVWEKETDPEEWATVMFALGNTCSDRITGNASDNQERAIACYDQALEVFNKDTFPSEWATVTYALGNVYSDRLQGSPSDNQEKAIGFYKGTLSIRTRDTDPDGWASTMYALGNVHDDRIHGNPSQNREEAIKYFNHALSFWDKKSFPTKWAMTMHALGNAYSERILADLSENQEKALDCFNQVLTVWKKSTISTDWARAIYSMAGVYVTRIRGNPHENRDEAIRLYKSVLSVWKKSLAPTDWANTMQGLGNAYREHSRGGLPENQDKAIRYYKHALSIFTRDAFSFEWAITQYQLGVAYDHRLRGNPSASRELALEYYRQALSVLKQETFPMHWAMVMQALGNGYRTHTQGSLSENREKAIQCYTRALSVWRLDVVPAKWAMLMQGLGNAFFERIKGDPSESQERAIGCYEQAASILKEDVMPMEWAATMHSLGNVYVVRIQGEPSENQEKAIACFQQVLSGQTRDFTPSAWALTTYTLGNVYNERISGDPSENHRKAVECYEEALSVWTKDTEPMSWAMAMYALGNTYRDSIPEDPLQYKDKAVQCYVQALSVWKRKTAPMDWSMAMYALGNVYRDIIQYDPVTNTKESIRCYKAALSALDTDTSRRLSHYEFALGQALWEQAHISGSPEALQSSFAAFNKALGTVSEVYEGITDPKGRKDYLRQNTWRYHFSIHALLEKAKYAEALYLMEKIRSQSLLQNVNLQHIPPGRAEAREAAAQYWIICREIRKLSATLAMNTQGADRPLYGIDRMPAQTSLPSVPNQRWVGLREELKENLRVRKRALHELRELDPDYVSLIEAEPLSTVELHDLLTRTGSAAVECFFDREQKSIHFLVAYPKGPELIYEHMTYERNATSLEKSLEEFLSSYRGGGLSSLTPLTTLVDQAGVMMQPVADYLEGVGIRTLYLSPHSFLQAVPLHAARLPRTNRYFLESFSVCYTPSITLSYRLSRDRAHYGKKVLAMFHSPTKSDRGDFLEYGEKEFERIFDTYGRNSVIGLRDHDASLENLVKLSVENRGELSSVNLICHSEATAQGLCLHLGRGPVSHTDVMRHLNLAGLPLVVLAACETGKSDEWIREYEEYTAMDSIFLQAGARGVVSSFYCINDASTFEIMDRFHRRIEEGHAPVEALHEAQREMILGECTSESSTAFRERGRQNPDGLVPPAVHPYYWAFLKYSGAF